jgi:hypothetical protein
LPDWHHWKGHQQPGVSTKQFIHSHFCIVMWHQSYSPSRELPIQGLIDPAFNYSF